MKLRALLLLLLSSTLVGCSFTEAIIKEPVVSTKPELIIEPPKQIIPRKVEFIVATPDNVSDVWKELGKKSKDKTLFALDDEGYEALSVNISEMVRYIKEQNIIIDKYKEYYSTINKDAE